jgi:DNA-binding winged helix-turn-helix (wHTH) protein
MISWLGGRRHPIRVLALLSVLGVVLAGGAWLAVHSALSARAADYRSRCLASASAIADAIPVWSVSTVKPDLRPLSQLAAMAGLLYVQVMSNGETLLTTSSFPGAESVLAEDRIHSLSGADLREINGRCFIDAVVRYYAPLVGTSDSPHPYAAGILRVGFDASALAWAATNTRALAAGLAALAWGTASVGLIWAVRRARLSASAGAPAPPARDPAARVARAGALILHIDEARLEARGRSIRLTPKQLDLLKVLMREPGRTFRDDEILSEAWSGSPYADSRDVRQYVYLVRRRLTAIGLPGERVLANVPGVGYRIDPAAAVDASDDAPAIDREREAGR